MDEQPPLGNPVVGNPLGNLNQGNLLGNLNQGNQNLGDPLGNLNQGNGPAAPLQPLLRRYNVLPPNQNVPQAQEFPLNLPDLSYLTPIGTVDTLFPPGFLD